MQSVSAGRGKLANSTTLDATQPTAKSAWVTPAIVQLPRLSELTLQSVGGDIPCGGGPGGGGSTVCP
jgi:hypothetical protein